MILKLADRECYGAGRRPSPTGNTGATCGGGDSGAARDPRDRLGGDENSAMIVEWGYRVLAIPTGSNTCRRGRRWP